VTQFDLQTGNPVRVISSPQFNFAYPRAMVVSGLYVYVANVNTGTIVKIRTVDGTYGGALIN